MKEVRRRVVLLDKRPTMLRIGRQEVSAPAFYRVGVSVKHGTLTSLCDITHRSVREQSVSPQNGNVPLKVGRRGSW